MKTQATNEQLKEMVKSTYSQIAEQSKEENASSCCGATGCATVDNAIMAEDYSGLKGYDSNSDLGLGCGLPTQYAHMKEGDTVIDLGSGAGNCLLMPQASTLPSGDRVMHVVLCPYPWRDHKARRNLPLLTSQRARSLPLATRPAPSGLKATLKKPDS